MNVCLVADRERKQTPLYFGLLYKFVQFSLQVQHVFFLFKFLFYFARMQNQKRVLIMGKTSWETRSE